MAPAVELAESLWQTPLETGFRVALAQLVMRELSLAGFWEHARPWADALLMLSGEDEPARTVRERAMPPDYLAPDVFDAVAGEVLYRYAPRECDTYQYVIDVMGTCNLQCPSCPVANTDSGTRPKGHMPLALFERILDKVSDESPVRDPAIWLFNWGEPALHPELPDMVRSIRLRGWKSTISSNLNGRKVVQRIAACPPDSIKISISGFTDASYQRSHTGGDLQQVIDNMHGLAEALRDAPATRVHVGHHLYRHTIDDGPALQSLCDTLGFMYQPIQAFWQPIERNHDLILGRQLADPLLTQLLVNPADNAAFVRAHRDQAYDCELRFNQTVINVDGSVALCCGVYEQENMLGLNFLETPHDELEAAKYRHSFCGTCRAAGTDYSLIRLPETMKANAP